MAPRKGTTAQDHLRPLQRSPPASTRWCTSRCWTRSPTASPPSTAPRTAPSAVVAGAAVVAAAPLVIGEVRL